MNLSIIILLRNEEQFVAKCLDSVLAQVGQRSDVEILCVDGASTDRTADIVREYTRRDPRMKLVPNPRKITPVAMNLGIRQSTGDKIVFLGGHAQYAEDYLATCEEVIERTGADVVGGLMKTMPINNTSIGRAIATATTSSFGVGNAAFRVGASEECEVDTVAYGCYRRSLFEKFGLFDERLVRNQDIELNTRFRRNGARILFSPKIRLTYFNRATFAGIRQQAYHNGMWNVYTLCLVGGGMRIRHFVPLGFVISLAGLVCLSVIWPVFTLLLAAEMLAYLSAATLAAYKAVAQERLSRLLVVWAYLNLHISYGVGSLVGLLTAPFRFGLRKKAVSTDALPDRRT